MLPAIKITKLYIINPNTHILITLLTSPIFAFLPTPATTAPIVSEHYY